jgi:hypothetical protein
MSLLVRCQDGAGIHCGGWAELVGWLTRALDFPGGAVLMTGTGIVPSSSFNLQAGDEVRIAVRGIGQAGGSITPPSVGLDAVAV